MVAMWNEPIYYLLGGSRGGRVEVYQSYRSRTRALQISQLCGTLPAGGRVEVENYHMM